MAPEGATGVLGSTSLLSYGVHVLVRLILRCSLLHCVTRYFLVETQSLSVPSSQSSKNLDSKMSERYI